MGEMCYNVGMVLQLSWQSRGLKSLVSTVQVRPEPPFRTFPNLMRFFISVLQRQETSFCPQFVGSRTRFWRWHLFQQKYSLVRAMASLLHFCTVVACLTTSANSALSRFQRQKVASEILAPKQVSRTASVRSRSSGVYLVGRAIIPSSQHLWRRKFF